MIWNPLKKKQDAESGAEQAPEPATQPAADDRTDPLLGAGQLEERVERLSPEGAEVELERVELWGADGITDRFLRLGVVNDGALATGIRRLLLELPEHTTGFRDLLFSNSHALRAKLDCPEHTLADLPGLLERGGIYLRPADLLGGLAGLARLFGSARELSGLLPQSPDPARIGLLREEHAVAGHARWRLVYFGWDQLHGADETASATALVKLFTELFGRLADTGAGRSLKSFAASLIGVRTELEQLLYLPGLDFARLAAPLCGMAAGIHGATDVGRRREHNEDAYLREQLELHSATGARLTLAAVADGMGGHASGEVASSLALALLRQQLGMALLAPTTRPVEVAQLQAQLEAIVPAIDRALTERAELDPGLSGMGTTLVGYCGVQQQSSLGGAAEQSAAVFSVGDSRAYLLGPCGLLPLTRDHSYVQDLLDAGSITAEEARSHQMKNVITRCLGGAGNVGTPDVFLFSPGPGEAILLCSDGLTDAIDDQQIWDVVRASADGGWDSVLQALIDAANAAGGPDNITVVVVEFRTRG